MKRIDLNKSSKVEVVSTLPRVTLYKGQSHSLYTLSLLDQKVLHQTLLTWDELKKLRDDLDFYIGEHEGKN